MDDEESDFNVDSLLNLDAMNEDMEEDVDEGGDFNVDSFLNLDGIDEEISVEALLEEVAAAGQPRQDPVPLVDTHTVPNAQVPAPLPVQHQQILGEASAYGFDDQMMMQAPIAQVRADHVQQHQAPIQHMMMPAPVANVQTDIQAMLSDQVQETDVLLQQLLGNPMSAFNFHGFDDEMPMMAPGGEEEFSGPSSPDSLEMHQYFEQNGYYDIAVALTSDEEDQAGSGGANGVPDVDDPMEGEWFVPLEPGRLQCDNCRVVREIRVQCETHVDFIRLHSATDGTFEHAIVDRKYTYIDADGEAPMAERLYMDFSRRRGEWVLYVMAEIVRSLKMTATVKDSDEAVNTTPVGNDAYQIMEIEMLMIIDSTPENVERRVPSLPPAQPVLVPSSSPPAAQPAPPPPPPAVQTALAMEAAANANLSVLSLEMIQPEILESWPFVREEQTTESARVHSARQQESMANSSEEEKQKEEIRQYLHELKEKAQMELDTRTPLAVKRFCRKMQWTFMLDLIRRINRNIIKLENKASHSELSRLLVIRDTCNGYVADKEKLRADITVGMNNEMESNGSYHVGKNDHEAGPSRAKKSGAP